MSCQSIQFALSECLDGRLPSAHRAAVMQHIAGCASCTQVWQKMQAAQSLVLGLDAPKVTVGFRESVWERVHSGEGASRILLTEQVGVATKLRYGLLGASAAAAFLFGLSYVFSDSSVTGPLPGDGNQHVAQSPSSDAVPLETVPLQDATDEAAPNGGLVARNGLQPRQANGADRAKQLPPWSGTASPRPLSDVAMTGRGRTPQLTTGLLASETVAKVTTAARRLRERGPVILGKRRDARTRDYIKQARDDVRTIDDGLYVLDRLRSRGAVVLDPKSSQCLTEARHTLKQHSGDRPRQVEYMIRTLQGCSLKSLETLQVQTPLENPHAAWITLFGVDPAFQRWVLHVFPSPGMLQIFVATDMRGAPQQPWPQQHRKATTDGVDPDRLHRRAARGR